MGMYLKFIEDECSAKGSCTLWVLANYTTTGGPDSKFYIIEFNGIIYNAPTLKELTRVVFDRNPK